ncbi:MAG: energy transducer TonB [Candidatus Omnitrophota bacterium]
MKAGTEFQVCLLASLITHVALIGAGNIRFWGPPEQKHFEIEFEAVQELLPDRYELEKEKKIEAPAKEEESTSQAIVEKLDEAFKKSFLRYQDSIKQKIQEEKTYPRAALRIGYQGASRIAFKVLSSGRVENLRLVQSSSFKELDREALDAVRRASPFRTFPADLKASEIEVAVDIVFKISRK